MRNKINKFFRILLVLIILIMLIELPVYAAGSRPAQETLSGEGGSGEGSGSGGGTAADSLFGDISSQEQAWSSMASNQLGGNVVDATLDVVLGVAQIAWFIGLGVSLVLIVRLGYKFITEPEERAEAKKSVLPVIVVVVILVGSYSVWKFFVTMFSS